MKGLMKRWEFWGVVLLLIYPWCPFLDQAVHALTGHSLGLERQLVNVFIFALVALALNLQVGYAGLLQLGIAAFFAIGAFTTGILTVDKYPFQIGFWGAIAAAPLAAGIAGLALAAPTIRLKGDYLAIVTLGFGEVVRLVILNLESITDGPRGLNPIPAPWIPDWLANAGWFGAGDTTGRTHYLTMYYTALVMVAVLVAVLATLEKTRKGRAFMALREDELASACMGLNPARIKLSAFAAGAAIAGLAGALYATNLTTTAEPNTYDFNYSIMVLCCLILGGLGSLRGALLGAGALYIWDNIVSRLLTDITQGGAAGDSGNVFTSFNNWRFLMFGLVLILMMRFRPEGLWPSQRMKDELRKGAAA